MTNLYPRPLGAKKSREGLEERRKKNSVKYSVGFRPSLKKKEEMYKCPEKAYAKGTIAKRRAKVKKTDVVAVWEVVSFPNGNVCYGATSLLWEGLLTELPAQQWLVPPTYVKRLRAIHVCRKVFDSKIKYPANGSGYEGLASFKGGEGEPERYQKYVEKLVAEAQ